MHSLFFHMPALIALALQSRLSNAAGGEKPDPTCTIFSPNTGSFYDLRSLALSLPEPDSDHQPSNPAKLDRWQAKGYDYQANFTLNICAPVIQDMKDVVGVDEALWQNVSAYYTRGGKTYSIGQESSDLVFRGRKLVLQYINGSPCGASKSKRELGGNTDDDAESKKSSKDKDHPGRGRKSTTISFHCDKDPLVAKVSTSFLGTDPDECAYFFEVRSPAACGGAEPVEQGVGPGGVFGIIVLIAVVVYFVGGVMYQRSVAHARGWRQLPNYSIWAGIWNFFSVSVQDLILGVRRFRGGKVTSVRDGILPTMEHRPIARAMHRSYGSRSNAAYYPP